ncbi:TIM-barrel domain-containing protein [Enterococcus sp. DIV0086]|uniref:TIM-barrel domain-containing protein n=1 Tax=Enterococcus sp. DIV0086 TaxID=2774655 RepID=UPI003D2A25AA
MRFIDPNKNEYPKKAIQESLNGEKNNYQFSARSIIDRYKKYDLPLGWFVPNDGYGAGYGQSDSLAGDIENLKEFGNYARINGVELGLWTQENISPKNPKFPEKEDRDLEKEIKIAGVASLKTDVAWVGEGYTFGLNGISETYKKMSSLNQKHPFIVILDGWAGTQRYASIWSGDQEGSDWQNIKFNIPTYLSTGISGNPNVGGDIDGIFGGNNPIIQTRDLQWKSFTPLQLSMDGWGSKPKDLGIQFGSEFLDINRFYLKLKTTLLPYFYSLAYESNQTGAPIVRPTFFNEYNEFTYGSSLETQFLVGKYLLVAPIIEPYQMKQNGDSKRASVYLPDHNTTWYDFFTGTPYKGGTSLADFDAPFLMLHYGNYHYL